MSEFELASRPHDVAEGQLLRLEGGREIAFQALAMGPGTRVSVRNLFWNVPARLKFLKSESSETGHVTDQVIRLALSFPRVAFRLECDERVVLDLPAGEIVSTRVRTLFGKDLAQSLIAVSGNAEGMELIGFVAHPREAKPTAKRQYVFLNGRFVRDKLLLAAVREGFKGFLEPRLHGAVFLHLDLEPSLVDVNVHPTKSEVRFRKEGEVFVLVSQTINKALAAHSGGFGLLRNDEEAKPAATFTMAPGYSRTIVKSFGSGERGAGSGEKDNPQPQIIVQERFLPQATHVEPAAPVHAAEPSTPYQAAVLPAPRSPLPVPAHAATTLPPGIRRVLQLHDMFLLIETDTGIRLIDQHALHEKALFLCLDPTRTDVLRAGVQPLLVPRSVELTASEVAVVGPLLADLLPYGIEAEVFGPATLLLRAHPAALKRVNWQLFFSSLAASGSQSQAVDVLRERIAHSAACHGAVKAGQVLSETEQLELVRLLYELEHMEHCPHGRPTTLDLSWAELSKRFQR